LGRALQRAARRLTRGFNAALLGARSPLPECLALTYKTDFEGQDDIALVG
jgi:hypothetical protein